MSLLDRYVSEMSSPADELLTELERETHMRAVHPHMISGHLQGRLLEMLVRFVGASTVLEIGTFTGYATLCMAAALEEDGIIDTIEADDEIVNLAAEFFARSPHRPKIRQHIGSALDIAPGLGRTYDIVYIDGGKREYPAYYRMIMGSDGNAPLVASGSVIIADNILWYGKVADTVANNDPDTLAIDRFNRMVREDQRVENLILPMRDGLNLIRVK